MSTSAGILIKAIGEALLASLGVTYSVKYGATDWSGVGRDHSAPTIDVRYTQEEEEIQGNTTSRVRPRISVYVSRPHTADPSTIASHQSTLDLMADVRSAIDALCRNHSNGSAPITGFAGPIFYDSATSTSAVMSTGGDSSGVESATIDFQLRYFRAAGGR